MRPLRLEHFTLFCTTLIFVSSVEAANCSRTSVGFFPLNDLGTGRYLNLYQGGLYPNGSNAVPTDHAALGTVAANSIVPLNRLGQASTNGMSVLLSIGMSNTSQEFGQFLRDTSGHPEINFNSLVILNGAAGGQVANTWLSPSSSNYARIRDEELTPRGLTERQVQAVWLKVANPGPSVSLPNPNADAFILLDQLGDIARTLKTRYPNLRMVFLSSRIYAGYADVPLNPEPYAYESGFSVKWLIEAQIRQTRGQGIDPIAGNLAVGTAAPWLAWGPYLWADGRRPRSDGLRWECEDFQPDGTHPSEVGREIISGLLLDFFLQSPFAAPWFAKDAAPQCLPDGDVDGDGALSANDALLAFGQFVGVYDLDACSQARADVDGVPGITDADAVLIYELFLDSQ